MFTKQSIVKILINEGGLTQSNAEHCTRTILNEIGKTIVSGNEILIKNLFRIRSNSFEKELVDPNTGKSKGVGKITKLSIKKSKNLFK